VAVKAIRGTFGKDVRRSDSRLYSGLNSCPHSKKVIYLP
jgi:hypothetical protein